MVSAAHYWSTTVLDATLPWLQCIDINECDQNFHECSLNSECENTIGSYNCKCKPGFNGDGYECEDIDECTDGSHQCSILASCNNTQGSYTCTCKTGYTGNGFECKALVKERRKRTAVSDVDPCEADINVTCPMGASCFIFTNGSSECRCHAGYRSNGQTTCTDINECNNESQLCPNNATCTNTIGSYICSCNSGYTGDGKTCSDINECHGLHECSPDATCTNTDGRYTCECRRGFTGDGMTCMDINECTEGSAYCPLGTICANINGTYRCQCNSSLPLLDHPCLRFIISLDDPCGYPDACPTNAECGQPFFGISARGHECYCNNGYTKDGTTCIDRMNVLMVQIRVLLMQHVPTQMVLLPVYVIVATLETDKIAVTLMNAVVDYMHVQLMLYVQTQRDHILVPVILASLEMESLAVLT